jgi:hypothetical protein
VGKLLLTYLGIYISACIINLCLDLLIDLLLDPLPCFSVKLFGQLRYLPDMIADWFHFRIVNWLNNRLAVGLIHSLYNWLNGPLYSRLIIVGCLPGNLVELISGSSISI